MVRSPSKRAIRFRHFLTLRFVFSLIYLALASRLAYDGLAATIHSPMPYFNDQRYSGGSAILVAEPSL